MTSGAFVPWAEPIAAELAEGRRQVIEFARWAPDEIWSRPSPMEGWTYKDILAHLAGGNDQMVQIILRSVVAHEPVDASILSVETDAANARGVEERRDWPVDKLVAELEEDGNEIQELLAGLRQDDEGLRQKDMPMSLGEFLRIVQAERHDLLHLEQLRAAIRQPEGTSP